MGKLMSWWESMSDEKRECPYEDRGISNEMWERTRKGKLALTKRVTRMIRRRPRRVMTERWGVDHKLYLRKRPAKFSATRHENDDNAEQGKIMLEMWEATCESAEIDQRTRSEWEMYGLVHYTQQRQWWFWEDFRSDITLHKLLAHLYILELNQICFCSLIWQKVTLKCDFKGRLNFQDCQLK